MTFCALSSSSVHIQSRNISAFLQDAHHSTMEATASWARYPHLQSVPSLWRCFCPHVPSWSWCWRCDDGGRPTEPEPSINWVQLSGVTLGVELWRDGLTCASITTNCDN